MLMANLWVLSVVMEQLLIYIGYVDVNGEPMGS